MTQHSVEDYTEKILGMDPMSQQLILRAGLDAAGAGGETLLSAASRAASMASLLGLETAGNDGGSQANRGRGGGMGCAIHRTSKSVSALTGFEVLLVLEYCEGGTLRAALDSVRMERPRPGIHVSQKACLNGSVMAHM